MHATLTVPSAKDVELTLIGRNSLRLQIPGVLPKDIALPCNVIEVCCGGRQRPGARRPCGSFCPGRDVLECRGRCYPYSAPHGHYPPPRPSPTTAKPSSGPDNPTPRPRSQPRPTDGPHPTKRRRPPQPTPAITGHKTPQTAGGSVSPPHLTPPHQPPRLKYTFSTRRYFLVEAGKHLVPSSAPVMGR